MDSYAQRVQQMTADDVSGLLAQSFAFFPYTEQPDDHGFL
jgi:hypothetical protein